MQNIYNDYRKHIKNKELTKITHFLGSNLNYTIDDLAKDLPNEDDEFLKGIWDKIQSEGGYEACFIDYGLEIHSRS
jgi:hypothetical protein